MSKEMLKIDDVIRFAYLSAYFNDQSKLTEIEKKEKVDLEELLNKILLPLLPIGESVNYKNIEIKHCEKENKIIVKYV